MEIPAERHDSLRLPLRLMRLGVYAIPFLPLYVSTSLLFPYVSGRNFVFRILTELLLVPLTALVWWSRRHRPSLSPTTVALLIFVSWVALADVLGANPYRSVWSTYQRMEGLLGLVHLVFFFFILKVALRSRVEWARYFGLSVAASTFVAILALFQFGVGVMYGSAERPGGTIGNAGNLAGYLLLHVFVCALMIASERRAALRRLFIASLCLDLATIYVSGTRSALLALVAIAPCLACIAAWRRRRKIASLLTARLALGAAAIVAAAALVLMRSAPLGGNFTRPMVGAGRWPRLLVWSSAWRAIREHVWIGWGQENFSVAWERHYVPAGGFFDRAHNIVLDWLSAGGIVALLALVAIIACAARNIRSISMRNRSEALALGGFVAAYLIFNMFWFDTFETYFLLISVMAFGDWFAASLTAGGGPQRESDVPVRGPLGAWMSIGAVGVVVTAAVYVLNLRPVFLAHDVAAALTAWAGGGHLVESRAYFEKAFSYPGLRSQDAIEQMAELVPQVVAARADTEPREVRLFVDRAIRELTALTTAPVVEARHVQMLGSVYANAAGLDPSYRALAIESFNRALAISPSNERIYAALADFYAANRDFERALAMLRRATVLAPYDSELQMALAPLALRTGRPADVELGIFRTHLAAEKNPVRLAAWYVRAGDFEIAKIVLEEMLKRDPNNLELLEQYRTVVRRLNEKK